MTKVKHGNYDRDRGIPDNHGQPSDSGLYVWLCDEVRQRWPADGAALVEACAAYGNRRYLWLLSQIEDRPGGAQLVEEFEERKKYVEAVKRQARRQHDLRRFEEQLTEYPNDTWRAQKVRRLQREIEKAEERWKFKEKH